MKIMLKLQFLTCKKYREQRSTVKNCNFSKLQFFQCTSTVIPLHIFAVQILLLFYNCIFLVLTTSQALLYINIFYDIIQTGQYSFIAKHNKMGIETYSRNKSHLISQRLQHHNWNKKVFKTMKKSIVFLSFKNSSTRPKRIEVIF